MDFLGSGVTALHSESTLDFFIDDYDPEQYITAKDGCNIQFDNESIVFVAGDIGQNAIFRLKGKGDVWINSFNIDIRKGWIVHLENRGHLKITGHLIDSLETICDGNSLGGFVMHRDNFTDEYTIVSRRTHPQLFLSTRMASEFLASPTIPTSSSTSVANVTNPTFSSLYRPPSTSTTRTVFLRAGGVFHRVSIEDLLPSTQSDRTNETLSIVNPPLIYSSNSRFARPDTDQTIRGETEEDCATLFMSRLSESTRKYITTYLSKDSMGKRVLSVGQTAARVSELTKILAKRYEDSITLELFHVPVLLHGKWQEFATLMKSTVKKSKASGRGFYMELKNPFGNIGFTPADIGAGYSKWEEFEEDLKEASDKLPAAEPQQDEEKTQIPELDVSSDYSEENTSSVPRPARNYKGLYSTTRFTRKKNDRAIKR